MLHHIKYEEAPRVYPIDWMPISNMPNNPNAINAIGTRFPSGTSILYSIAHMKTGTKFHHISFARLDGQYPHWDEMRNELRKLPWLDQNKAIFMVIPPEKEYVNVNPTCLHWWQKID